ncbi:MAG TPA: phospholipase D-like domain-containing protein [Flavihumibacter sp.]|nr:phospholipase D-like domain-containing protein [Flavihumibacter sp.]
MDAASLRNRFTTRRKGFTQHNTVELVRGGSAYFERLASLMAAAKQSFHLQVYIFEQDETGTSVINNLCATAKRGVITRLLVDGYGSRQFPDSWREQLAAAGVQFRLFRPLFSSGDYYFGRRLHHKVAVADGQAGLVGGRNISDRYNDLPAQQAWLDWAVYVEGEAAHQLYAVCDEVFYRANLRPGSPKRENRQLPAWFKKGDVPVAVRRQDWVRRQSGILRSYLHMIYNAEREVFLLSSYFLPGTQARRAMAKAVARGVNVKVIIAGKSDVHIAKEAERYLYRWLLRNKVEVYEYLPQILHGKIATADGIWATVGSFNLNMLSAYASIELNLEIVDAQFAGSVATDIKAVIDKETRQVTANEWRMQENWLRMFWQRVCYSSLRFFFFLFTFYYRRLS